MKIFITLWAAALMSSVGLFANTIVHPNPGSEPNTIDILEARYGAGNFERVDDTDDEVWGFFGLDGIGRATAIAKNSAAAQQLAICVVCDGTDDDLFDQAITDNGLMNAALTLGGGTLFALPPTFSFVNHPTGHPVVGRVTSLSARNPLGVDQFVTYRVTNSQNVFVLAIEDWVATSTPASDRDFNDFIVEVQLTPPGPNTIPEPSTYLLFGAGLTALAWLRRKRGAKS